MTSAPQAQQAAAPPRRRARRDAARPLQPYDAADHLTRLYRLAVGLCGSRHLAEDLVQETYARLLARPRMVLGNEFSYLARALRNVFIDHVRAEQRRDELPAPEHLDPPDPRPTANPEAAAMAGDLYRAIAALPEPQRQVIASVDMAGMTYAEAAALLGVPIGTIMSRLYRAREAIGIALKA